MENYRINSFVFNINEFNDWDKLSDIGIVTGSNIKKAKKYMEHARMAAKNLLSISMARERLK